MKRKDLIAYIREQIISELSEGGTKAFIASSSSDEENALIADPTISGTNKTAGKKALQGSRPGTTVVVPTNEVDLDELALEGSGARYTAGPKFKDAKEIYTTGLYAELLKAIEEAGEKGLTQKELGSILGKGDGSDLNLTLKNLRTVGVLVNSKIAAKAAAQTAKPEEPKTAEKPEAEEPDEWESRESEDDWENEPEEEETPEEEPEEEETPEEEPAAATKASDELGKYVDELAKLNKEKDDLLKKLKAKEITMDQYKEKIGTIPQQIKVLQAKIDRYSE